MILKLPSSYNFPSTLFTIMHALLWWGNKMSLSKVSQLIFAQLTQTVHNQIFKFMTKTFCCTYKFVSKSRGSSKLVSLASQLTKPLKVKRLFPSLVCFLNPSPEAPRGIDLKWENMISILIITNLICWLPVCRKTDWLCYEFLGGK